MTDSNDTSNLQEAGAGGGGGMGGGSNGATPGFGPAPAQPSIMPIAAPAAPPTSLGDGNANNLANNSAAQVKRPRDARLVHMVLASRGITAYEERVPLQLLDFAYRYTSSVLQDAIYLNAEGYANAAPSRTNTGGGAGGGGGGGAEGGAGGRETSHSLSLAALRLSIASRLHYQFNSSLPKDFLLELASERNKVALPPVRQEWGVRLPPEKHCLTGVGWGLKDQWDSEMEDEVADDDNDGNGEGDGDGEGTVKGDDGEEEDEDEDAQMEDLFRDDLGDGGEPGAGGQGEGEDRLMTGS